MVHRAGASHVGSCFSIVDILYVLYFKVLRVDPTRPDWHQRDRFVLSKAHGSAALYAVLAERGFFPREWLDTYAVSGGVLAGHLDATVVPGVETSGGSLGHGLPIGVGMALALSSQEGSQQVYVLVGDGECNEGSVWEAAMLAGSLRLKNLTVIVDKNGLQGFGLTQDVISQNRIADQWRACGWDVDEVDGHDLSALERVLAVVTCGAPRAIICHTVKGKGVSFMEGRLEWHYRSPDAQQYAQAMRELS
jgi:transketolase